MKDLGTVLAILAFFTPLLISIVRLVGQKTHNQVLVNLSNRADIIVSAVETIGGPDSGPDKQNLAQKKLAAYAKEVGIKVTPAQLDEYIEAAVTLMKADGKEQKKNDGKEQKKLGFVLADK